MPVLLLTCLMLVTVAGCDAENDPVVFYTPSPDLGFQKAYTGRLALEGNCLVLVLGERMLSRDDAILGAGDVAVPLFNRGFSLRLLNNRPVINTPEGLQLPIGSIVSGEGGPYPTLPIDPRSAPVQSAPDTSRCKGQAYQINSMYASDLSRPR